MTGEKIYVLDTNVLIHDPRALFAFKGAHVAVPIFVIEELDKLKNEVSGRGKSARDAIRYLDILRDKGSLGEGAALENGGIVQVVFIPEGKERERCLAALAMEVTDNQILATAVCLKKKYKQVKFISKDLSARVKADALGLETEDYLKEKVEVSEENFYTGSLSIDVPIVSLKKGLPDQLRDVEEEYQLSINQFVVLRARHNPEQYRIFRYLGRRRFVPVEPPRIEWPLQARNAHQLMALDLLLDNTIQLVTLLGPAGTGKTFLALLAGLHKALVEGSFQKLLISRPVVPLGRDIGYLPGDVSEKLHSWMQPIYDNMELILHYAKRNNGNEEDRAMEQQLHGKAKKRHRRQYHERLQGGLRPLDDLIREGRVSLEAITYMRGRSIPYQYILIDEVQNLSPHEVKTIISRVGEGSKIILTGDPFQIDSPYLDFSSNGLVVASNVFKGQPIFGSIFLEHSERSELSQLASELM